jgi:hypothetical protein
VFCNSIADTLHCPQPNLVETSKRIYVTFNSACKLVGYPLERAFANNVIVKPSMLFVYNDFGCNICTVRVTNLGQKGFIKRTIWSCFTKIIYAPMYILMGMCICIAFDTKHVQIVFQLFINTCTYVLNISNFLIIMFCWICPSNKWVIFRFVCYRRQIALSFAKCWTLLWKCFPRRLLFSTKMILQYVST